MNKKAIAITLVVTATLAAATLLGVKITKEKRN